MLGTKPAPIPWILWGEGFPPESTALSAGSTATALKDGFFGLMYSHTPVMVPPVPTPDISVTPSPHHYPVTTESDYFFVHRAAMRVRDSEQQLNQKLPQDCAHKVD